MKSLEVIQSIFTWYCICPVDKDAFHLVKSLRIVSILIFYIVEIFTILASVAYFSKNFSIDLENALYGFFQVVILMNAMYALTIGLAIRKDIQRIFKEFQICYEKSRGNDSLAYLKEVNDKVNRTTKLYMKYCVAGILLNIVIGCLACILLSLAFEGRIDNKYFIYPGRYIVPWDQKTLIGWLAMTTCTSVTAGHYYTLNGLLLLFFVGICEHNVAFYKQFNDLIEDLDCKILYEPANHHSLKSDLCKIIKSHIDTGKLFAQTAEVFSPFVLGLLLSSMVFMSCAMFQMDMALNNPVFDFNLLVLLSAVLITTLNLFFYCYHGDRSTQTFLERSVLLFESKWYRLPIDLQEFFILMIANAQIPLYYHGFRLVNLDLQTFCDALQIVFKFYMMFKTLTTN